MKIKNIVTVLLVAFILASCAPAAKVVPTETAIPTSTVTPAPTAPIATISPTLVPSINVAGLNIPDPRFSNPVFFDFNNANSPIVQFANAFGIKPEEVGDLTPIIKTGADGKQFVVMTTGDLVTTTSFDESGTPLLIAEQESDGNWTWKQNDWLLSANTMGFPIGIEIDYGHPNHNEQGYKEFVFNNANVINISGGFSHQWLRYGKAYAPEIVKEYKARNPNVPLTIDANHLFYHHDTFPPELSDKSKPLAERQQLARDYMRERVREVLEIIAPIMEQYPDAKIMVNLGNEVVWEYQGNTGWEGEYRDFPLYDLLGKDWLPEAYMAFDEVRNEFNLPRDKFTLLLNGFGAEMPGLASDYYVSQKQWVISQIAKRLGVSPKEVQLATGIQFGLEVFGENPNDAGVIYKKKVLKLLETEEGRQKLVTHLNSLKGGFYVTELVTDDPETMNKMLEVLGKVDRGQIKGVIFWSALVRPKAGVTHYAGNTVVDKKTYAPLPSYYELLRFLLDR